MQTMRVPALPGHPYTDEDARALLGKTVRLEIHRRPKYWRRIHVNDAEVVEGGAAMLLHYELLEEHPPC